RQTALDLGLHVAGKPESQEICFVPTKNYRDYLREHDPETLRPGPIVDGEGNTLGQHEGVAFYTVGQRRGLGLASPHPLFVTELRPSENALVVGDDTALYRTDAYVSAVNWMAIEGLDEAR